MNAEERQEFSDLIGTSINKALDDRGHTCNRDHCLEVCNITPRSHADDHAWILKFRELLGDTSKTMRSVVIKTVLPVLLLALFLGLYFGVFKFKP